MSDIGPGDSSELLVAAPAVQAACSGARAQNRPKGSRSPPFSAPSLERASVSCVPISPPAIPAARVSGGPEASKPVSHPCTCGTTSIPEGSFVSAQVQVKARGLSGRNVVPGHTSLDVVRGRGHQGGTGPGSSPCLPDALPTLPMPENQA